MGRILAGNKVGEERGDVAMHRASGGGEGINYAKTEYRRSGGFVQKRGEQGSISF